MLISYLLLFLIILYILLSWWKIDWAFLVIIFILPAYLIRFNLFHIPFTFLEIIFLIYAYFWFFENYQKIFKNIKDKIQALKEKKRTSFSSYPFSLPIILFISSSFIALAVANFSNSALGIYKAYFIEAVFLFIFSFNFLIKNGKEKIIFILSLSSFFLSSIALWQKLNGLFWSGGGDRVSSIFPYPNALGLFLGPIIVLLYFYIMHQFKNKKIKIKSLDSLKIVFLVFSFFLSILAIYFAKSDGALIAVSSSLFFGSFFINKKFAFTFSLIGLITLVFIFSQNNLKTYILEKIQLKDFSGEVRKAQWKETYEMMTSSPRLFIFGTGLSNYQKEIKPFHQEGIFFNKDHDPDFRRKIVIFNDKYKAEHWRPVEIYMYPHNILLNFWTELGLFGVFAFLYLIIQFFYFGVKLFLKNKNNIFVLGLIFLMIEIIIHGLVDVPYFKNDLSFLFWIFIALMGVERVLEDKKYE